MTAPRYSTQYRPSGRPAHLPSSAASTSGPPLFAFCHAPADIFLVFNALNASPNPSRLWAPPLAAAAAGFSLAGGALWASLAFVAAFAFYIATVVPVEERMLREAFGDQYERYE